MIHATKNEIETSGHIRALDGIRGVAVFVVVAYHALSGQLKFSEHLEYLTRPINMGWAGVDLFFVLSGFLITTILIDARAAENFYKVFYMRRALRILPLYYVVLVSSLLLMPGHYSWNAQIWFWLNLSNLPTAFNPVLIGFLSHFWSLAIEEQFYLCWPSVVRLVSPSTLSRICCVSIVSILILRNMPAVLRENSTHHEFVYRITFFRIDTLLAGALLAVGVRYYQHRLPSRSTLRVLACTGYALCAWLGESYTRPLFIRFGYTSLLVALTSTVALTLYPNSLSNRIFSIKPLRVLGKYSYAIYLLHPFLINAVIDNRYQLTIRLQRSLHLSALSINIVLLGLFPIELALVVLLAMFSWWCLEEPILAFKKHFRYKPKLTHHLA